MTSSEHDRQVLQALENDMTSDGRDSSRSSVSRRTLVLLAAVAGLVIGLLAVFVGLRLDNATGTSVGVAGSVVLVAGAWLGAENASPWPRFRRSSQDGPKS